MPQLATIQTNPRPAKWNHRQHPLPAEAMAQMVAQAARRMMRRLAGRGGSLYDDLYSAGMLALVEAGARFDTSRGVDFEIFVQRRIQGAMLDELRRLDTVSRARRWAIKNNRDRADAPPCPRLVAMSSADDVADPAMSLEENLFERESMENLSAAERVLPERLRLVLRLRIQDGWKVERIAAHLGVTQGRVSQLVSEAVTKLRATMHAHETV